MKIIPVFALLAACAPIIAHAQTADAPADAMPADVPDVAAIAPLPMAPKAAPAVDAYRWRFAPPVGSRWTMRTFTRTDINQKYPSLQGEPAHDVKVGGFTNLVADYDVINRDQFGASTIRVTYRQMTESSKVTVDGKLMDAMPAKDGIYRNINGASYTIKQAPDGRVWGIDGLNAVQSKMLQAAPGLDAASRAALSKLTSSLASEDSLRKMMSVAADAWPKYPIRAGESWNYSIEMPAGFPMQFTIESKRTLKALDPEIASIDEAATYNNGSFKIALPTGADGAPMKINIENFQGKVSGYSRVQRSSGIALQNSIVQTFSGIVMAEVPAVAGAAPLKVRVPMTATSDTRIVMEPRG